MTQLVQQLLITLGLIYADIYGASFYSAMTELHLTKILERFGPVIHSFADLYRYCTDRAANKGQGGARDWENARHLHAVLNRLAKIFPLNATAEDFGDDQRQVQNAIQVEDILSRPCVVYFCLPSLLEPVTARCIAKLFLFALIAAGTLFKFEGRPTVRVAAFIDEAHIVRTTPTSGRVTQWFVPQNVMHLAKLVQVLAFALADDGCVGGDLQNRLQDLADRLDVTGPPNFPDDLQFEKDEHQ